MAIFFCKQSHVKSLQAPTTTSAALVERRPSKSRKHRDLVGETREEKGVISQASAGKILEKCPRDSRFKDAAVALSKASPTEKK